VFPENTQAKNDGVDLTVCGACGQSGIAAARSICPVCGKMVSEGFQPLDAIRSSHGLQRRKLKFDADWEDDSLFHRDRNPIAEIARASVVYSMMPYLGILFVPIALVSSGLGYLAFRRDPQIGGDRVSRACMAVSLILLAVQVMLWWLLYIIPELGLR
jgi:hypothetical protein